MSFGLALREPFADWSKETSFFAMFAFLAAFKVLIKDFFWIDINFLHSECVPFADAILCATNVPNLRTRLVKSQLRGINHLREEPAGNRIRKGEKLTHTVKN
jgi:hypothetical protein